MTTTKPKMRFKLLRGSHAVGGQSRPDGTKVPLVMHRPGAIIESDVDLCARFNSPGSTKFERLE